LDKIFLQKVPGCKGMPHKTLVGGHFLQEDSGAVFAQAVNDLILDNNI
jgi:haloalkane dehalogenase